MGKWAKTFYGKEKFGDIGIVVAGTIKKDFQNKVLKNFDKVISY